MHPTVVGPGRGEPLPDQEQRRLVGPMQVIEAMLGPSAEGRPAYLLRLVV